MPKVVRIPLPDDMTEDYIITVYNGTTVVEERMIPAGTLYTEVELYGKGKIDFTVMVNNGLSWTLTVDFDEKTEGPNGD